MRTWTRDRGRQAGLATFCALLAFCRLAEPAGVDTKLAPSTGSGTIPNVDLITHENTPVRFYDDLVKGKVVLVNFMYTTCDGLCPRTTANLVRVQAALGERVGRDIFLYSITMDPEIDTPEVLKRYAEDIGAKPGWTFLTGRRGTIERLRRRLGVSDRDPVIDADKTQHSGVLVYGNEALDRWAMMPGLTTPEFIAARVLHVAPGGRRRTE